MQGLPHAPPTHALHASEACMLEVCPHAKVRWGHKSGGEALQGLLHDTLVYKAFNTIAVDHMAHPEGLTMLLAGRCEQSVGHVGMEFGATVAVDLMAHLEGLNMLLAGRCGQVWGMWESRAPA